VFTSRKVHLATSWALNVLSGSSSYYSMPMAMESFVVVPKVWRVNY